MPSFRRAATSHRAKPNTSLDEHLLHQKRSGRLFEARPMRDAIEGASIRKWSPGAVMQLQRTIGNRAVNQLLTGTPPRSAVIQRNPITDKLTQFALNKDHGQVINMLAEHLLKIIKAYSAGDWATAYDGLYNSGVEGKAKHRINLRLPPRGYIKAADYKTQEEIDAAIAPALSKGMYFPNSGKLDLPEIAVLTNGGILGALTPGNDAHLAMMVLPVALEEWIHMFQHQINGFLSDLTYSFQQSPEAQANLKGPDTDRWDMNEVDIYAIYRELGWHNVLDAFRSRYEERQKFEDFMSPGGAAVAKKKKKCYLTTACVRARGLDDDCEELRTLRAFRDGYVLLLPAGEALVEAYYESAPEIVRGIEARQDAAEIYEGIYGTVRACVRAIGGGREAAALSMYARAVIDLRAAYAPEAPLAGAIVRLISPSRAGDDEPPRQPAETRAPGCGNNGQPVEEP